MEIIKYWIGCISGIACAIYQQLAESPGYIEIPVGAAILFVGWIIYSFVAHCIDRVNKEKENGK